MDVSLAIQLTDFVRGETLTDVIHPLTALGGRLVAWRPELDGTPIHARFELRNAAERDQFVIGALKIPGVSLGANPTE